MLVFANNLLRDSIYGTVWRVSIGAALSIVDAGTDLYVIGTYYTEGLNGKAAIMCGMISANMFIQLLFVVAQYNKKSWGVRLKEILITILFIRPAVDAYRVSTNYNDGDATVGSLNEMIFNKVRAGCIFSLCFVCRWADESVGAVFYRCKIVD